MFPSDTSTEMAFQRSRLFFLVFIMLLLVSVASLFVSLNAQELLECATTTSCPCGSVIVLAGECVCPDCPAPIHPHHPMETVPPLYHQHNDSNELETSQTTKSHSRSARSSHEKIHPDMIEQENNHKTCPHFYQEPKSQQDCQYHCKFGGVFKYSHKLNSLCNECECYCGPNQMTYQQEPVKNCDKICPNEYILDIERAKNGCQSKCICSKNIVYDYFLQEKQQFNSGSFRENKKLYHRICLFLEKHAKNSPYSLTRKSCNEECGKNGGSLIPYQVVTTNSETGQTEKHYCSNQATFCKCHSSESKESTMDLISHTEDIQTDSSFTSSQCQHECGGYPNVDYVENIFQSREITNEDSIRTSSPHKKYHCHCK